VFADSISNEEDQLVVDWYKSWSKDNKAWTCMFVNPLDDFLNPKCIRIVYYTHQVYSFPSNGLGCDGLVYDTSKLVPLYEQPILYSTADVLDQSLFQLSQEGFFPRFRLINLFFTGKCYHVSYLNMWETFAATMVHPINGLPPQDMVSVYFEGVDNYDNFNPGPLSADLPNSLTPSRVLIFIACATTLAFCTYLGYGYFC
jgi:hypothetical protein